MKTPKQDNARIGSTIMACTPVPRRGPMTNADDYEEDTN